MSGGLNGTPIVYISYVLPHLIFRTVTTVTLTETFLTLPEAIENLTLSLCKCQKCKEQVKISKCRRCGDLKLKTVTLVRFLKTKNTPKF